jgi:hypothetical protein
MGPSTSHNPIGVHVTGIALPFYFFTSYSITLSSLQSTDSDLLLPLLIYTKSLSSGYRERDFCQIKGMLVRLYWFVRWYCCCVDAPIKTQEDTSHRVSTTEWVLMELRMWLAAGSSLRAVVHSELRSSSVLRDLPWSHLQGAPDAPLLHYTPVMYWFEFSMYRSYLHLLWIRPYGVYKV